LHVIAVQKEEHGNSDKETRKEKKTLFNFR
jgi:hypothetical protein